MTHVYDPATAINDPNGITWGMHPIAWRNDDIPEVGEWNTIDFTEPYAFIVEHGYKDWILVEKDLNKSNVMNIPSVRLSSCV